MGMKSPFPHLSPKSLSCFSPGQFPVGPNVPLSVSNEKKLPHRYCSTSTFVLFSPFIFLIKPTVRKQEIIKVTEQLIEAISNGDFESYT